MILKVFLLFQSFLLITVPELNESCKTPGFLNWRAQLQSLKKSSSYLQNKYLVCKNLPWTYFPASFKELLSFLSTISWRRFHWFILSWDCNACVSEFNKSKPRLKFPKNQFQLIAGLNLEKLNTILSGTNHIWAAAQIL